MQPITQKWKEKTHLTKNARVEIAKAKWVN